VTVEPDLVTLGIEPFPCAGTTRLELRGRRIAARPYRGDAELALELAAARWERLAVRLAPLGA